MGKLRARVTVSDDSRVLDSLSLWCMTASLVWEAPSRRRRNTAFWRLSYMSALQFKPVPSRLGMVLGGGREDLFWPNVPGWLDPCVVESGCADGMRW
jgi:hypothetical protein